MKKIKNFILITAICITMYSCGNTSNKHPAKKESSSQQAKEKTNKPLLEKGKAGNVLIGMPIKKLENYFSEKSIHKSQENNEGYVYEMFYILGEEGDTTLYIEPDECEEICKVWRVTILSPDYKTNKNIGIGSSYVDLQKHYTINWTTINEEGIIARVEEIEMSFILDKAGISANSMDEAGIPPGTKIVKIIIS